jgi:phosphatidylserine/phosphatidylglycerophosphate/cardiolipin synthase-like enzyme
MASEFPPSFTKPWKALLTAHRDSQLDDLPNHHVSDFSSLVTTSRPRRLHVGTGHALFRRALVPAVLSARRSVHFVTCYWADSPSRDALRDALVQLAARRPAGAPTLRVTVGFSSSGLLQKLLHTASRDGHVYPPARWPALGLPDQATLAAAGIHLTVKSLFFTPLSVMHPKYVLIDGQRAWVPSCNVSWERWFEGCVELEGGVVDQLMAFHERVWRFSADESSQDPLDEAAQLPPLEPSPEDSASQSLQLASADPVPTIFLPSSHHRNPRFSCFPFLSHANPPMTPLNAALLTLVANARREITILTPNVTSWPLVHALLAALRRGVHVQLRTSRDMMLIEQLVTAGTLTSWCLRSFVKRYERMRGEARRGDVEAQAGAVGNLEILYYKALPSREGEDDEPVVSHFKMTMVDGEYVVLGSGNMDRASWWTSQEIGVLFYQPGFGGHALWDGVLRRRTEVMYRSA